MALSARFAKGLAAFLILLPNFGQHAIAATPAVQEQQATSRAEALLLQVFAQDAEREDSLEPLSALFRGETVDGAALAREFTDSLDRDRLASARESLARLKHIDRARLSPEHRISFDVFAQAKSDEVGDLQPDIRELTGVRPFNHFGGLHVEFPTLMSSTGSFPYRSAADYELALEIDAAFAKVLENAELRFREGMAKGIVEPKLTVRIMISQLDALLAQKPEESPFYSPVTAFPEGFPDELKVKFRSEFDGVIGESIAPAYRRLRNFLADEYLTAARDEIGLSGMKGGTFLYRRLVERETTLKLDPEEVHSLGLGEVARIRLDMEEVKHRLGFEGDLAAFFGYVRDDPRFHPQSRQELADGFTRIGREVAERVPALFASIPRTPLAISPFPAFREQFEPGGAYYQGSPDGTRPGTFYYNTFDLPSRFLTGMTTLYLHEASPGHHFQISLAQENEDLPDFQRFDGNNAFVEGWALYAETLGYEMGLFDDPMQRWGTLDDEMLRAMRLVVDTGIHAMGWSRDQAIDYMLDNSGMSRADAVSEVDRYIAIPGQALSYKIGALTIQKLRREAEARLGERFDIRAFHAQVLGSGALPLGVLRTKIEEWIAGQQ